MNRVTRALLVAALVACLAAAASAAKPSCGRNCVSCTQRCADRLHTLKDRDAVTPLCRNLCYENGPSGTEVTAADRSQQMRRRERAINHYKELFRTYRAHERAPRTQLSRMTGRVSSVGVLATFGRESLQQGKILAKDGMTYTFDPYAVRAMGVGVYELGRNEEVYFNVLPGGKAGDVCRASLVLAAHTDRVLQSAQDQRRQDELAAIKLCAAFHVTSAAVLRETSGSGASSEARAEARASPRCTPRTPLQSPLRFWADEHFEKVASRDAGAGGVRGEWAKLYADLHKLLAHYDYDGAIKNGPISNLEFKISQAGSQVSSSTKALRVELRAALGRRDRIAAAVLAFRQAGADASAMERLRGLHQTAMALHEQ